LLIASASLYATRATWLGWLPAERAPLGQDLLMACRVLGWIGATWLAVRLAELLVRARFERVRGREVPHLLHDLVAGGLWLAGLFGVAVQVFGMPLTTAFTTSSVVIAIVGFAVRHMIADLFYGVTLALERPFEIGDWIQIPDGSTGQVTEFTWRAVKFVTRQNLKVVVPNSTLATNQIVNYDEPDPTWRTSFRITLGYQVEPRQAERLLLSAVEQVPESAALPNPPEALIVEYELEGVVWELRFWVPDFPSGAEIRQRVHEALLRNIHYAGIRVPRQREEVLVGRLDDERAAEWAATRNWIERIELFAPLPSAERSDLQARARRLEIPRGAEIVRRNEPGASLFVLAEGALEVWLEKSEEGSAAARMRPGDFFGEMSLLTGEPRSATVVAAVDSLVYEITQSELAPVLSRHPALPQQLAQVLAARSQADVERASARDAEASQPQATGRAAQLLSRIRACFKLPEAAAPEPTQRESSKPS
jgi:small-conductance mechanosensitive channel